MRGRGLWPGRCIGLGAGGGAWLLSLLCVVGCQVEAGLNVFMLGGMTDPGFPSRRILR